MKINTVLLCSLATTTLLLTSACQEVPDHQSESSTATAVLVDNETAHADVKAAILDYVEGIYEVDSTRIERSVHQELRKRGYWYDTKSSAYRDNLDMTYEQLVHLAATWNKSGERANADSPKKIDIYDVNDRTASAKLTAEWGIDYFHLAKLDGKWYIMNVLWQSMPERQN